MERWLPCRMQPCCPQNITGKRFFQNPARDQGMATSGFGVSGASEHIRGAASVLTRLDYRQKTTLVFPNSLSIDKGHNPFSE